IDRLERNERGPAVVAARAAAQGRERPPEGAGQVTIRPFSSGGFAMTQVKITVHSTGSGTCSLTGKEDTDGLNVSFEDATVREAFLSWKAFRQLLGLKAGKTKPVAAGLPPALPVGNGAAVVK